jgi:hypothetical protein
VLYLGVVVPVLPNTKILLWVLVEWIPFFWQKTVLWIPLTGSERKIVKKFRGGVAIYSAAGGLPNIHVLHWLYEQRLELLKLFLILRFLIESDPAFLCNYSTSVISRRPRVPFQSSSIFENDVKQ